jgi:hypothetical protein
MDDQVIKIGKQIIKRADYPCKFEWRQAVERAKQEPVLDAICKLRAAS